ncbi:MAG: M28 family peptidase, partial [Clostridia bacterium]|nr:M28 family peptidase [Clostridia bacterium]
MTETTKGIFDKYQVRKTKKQKNAFAQYVKQIAERHEYEFKIENGFFGARNIVIGNPDTAKVLYTAHYDTCAHLPFPNLITPKNFLIYLLYQLLIVGFFFVFAFAIVFLSCLILSLLPVSEDVYYIIISVLPQIIVLVMLYLLLGGPANKNTANDNTSGVTTILNIVEALPQNKKNNVAFVLFDLEEAGLWGSLSFASKHKTIKNNTMVINFDCVSDGDTILFVLNKTTQQYASILE